MIVSEAQVHEVTPNDRAAVPGDAVAAPSVEGGEVWIRVRPSTHQKCIRCWQHRPDVGQSPEHPQICLRCVGNLSLPGETRRFS
jgi:isoleucyl-tRNA synthetase